jgi:hypothetical protein
MVSDKSKLRTRPPIPRPLSFPLAIIISSHHFITSYRVLIAARIRTPILLLFTPTFAVVLCRPFASNPPLVSSLVFTEPRMLLCNSPHYVPGRYFHRSFLLSLLLIADMCLPFTLAL